jgi:hypothetical protein
MSRRRLLQNVPASFESTCFASLKPDFRRPLYRVSRQKTWHDKHKPSYMWQSSEDANMRRTKYTSKLTSTKFIHLMIIQDLRLRLND